MNKTEKKDMKSDKKHVCLTCGASFNRPYRLTQHLLMHQKIKIFQCGEEGCDKSYTSRSHLDRHLLTVHIQTDFSVVHRCPECMKTFSNRQNLKRHLKIRHASSPGYICDVCRTFFKKKHLLLTHMYHHTLVKPFSCELCSKEFISISDKKKHMKRHKTYNCDTCNMTFDRWTQYLKHKKIEHDVKEYICDDCGRKFKQRKHMVHHVNRHKKMDCKEKKTFKCWYQDCGRVYSRNSNLKQHIEMYHTLVKYSCEICDLQLSSKVTLKKHLKLHTRPIKLPEKNICRKERKDKGSMKNITALKLAGLFHSDYSKSIENNIEAETICSTTQDEVKSLPSTSNITINMVKHEDPNSFMHITVAHDKTANTADKNQDMTLSSSQKQPIAL